MLILPSSFSKPEVTSPEETVSSCTSKEADLILESNSLVREWLTTRMESMSMFCCVVTISNTRATFAYYSFCDNLRQCTLGLLSLFAVIFKLISSEKK